jgi:hypothetical protein
MSAFSESFQKELGKVSAQAIAAALTVIFSVAAFRLDLDKHTARVLLLCLAAISLLALVCGLVFRYRSSHKVVVPPMAARQPAPTPQQIRQQKINEQMEYLSQFPKQDVIQFEMLKRLSHNPRDGSIDAQGAACLFYEGRVTKARPALKDLLDYGYIERTGPAMHGEGNNHYKISEKGIICVNIHAA